MKPIRIAVSAISEYSPDENGSFYFVSQVDPELERLQKLADAVLLFADEFGLDSWVEDDAAEHRTNTPEQKLHAAISEYKTGTPK